MSKSEKKGHRPPAGFVFEKGAIEGVQLRKIRKFVDERGWLAELWRTDEPREPSERVTPAMCYASLTRPGIVRGPHEHIDQTDWFCFMGPSNFLVCLWDNRPRSPSYGKTMRFVVGEDDPTVVIIPEGIVHAYKNVGTRDGLVTNLPNRLFMGEGKQQPVDEIRHEDEADSPFEV